MTKVITLCTTKGGTSKTSLTASLLSYWHSKKRRVAAVDADPNCNLTRWLDKGSLSDLRHVAETNEGEIIEAVENISTDRDLVLVDVAGFGNQSMVYAIGISSFVIIPCRPSEDDVLEALKTKQVVTNAAKLTRREIPYKVVLTQVKAGTLVINHTHKQFQAFNVPLFDTAIASRTIYQTSRFSGETPITAEPQGKAAKEIAALAKEIEVQLSL
ncbi:ParA family protein [Pleurocapsa sp. PCC 7319]|uniref:ParA family protein n=1 Tax=Pleurocapsa sp. PCC 7319 TaxID=118161 RepID=UPI00068400EE|nr:ParA family protein [Pleurocapsa sp. PCC 7319]